MSNDAPGTGVGRPRSRVAHDAIIRATLELLEQGSVRDVTIEGIARTAGVGKPTIYRWWPSKNALLVDAVFSTVEEQVTYPPAPTTRAALIAQVRVVAELLASGPGRRLAEFVGEGQSDPDTLREINERFTAVRRAAARELIRAGQQGGEISESVDPDTAIDLIYGPLYYRLLFQHLPLSADFAETIVELALSGIAGGIPVKPSWADDHQRS
jgi:AcrR family transcriptional regulator